MLFHNWKGIETNWKLFLIKIQSNWQMKENEIFQKIDSYVKDKKQYIQKAFFNILKIYFQDKVGETMRLEKQLIKTMSSMKRS